MRVTVIATVLNEGSAIARILESLASQSRRPDEVVIVDGGSTDGTWEILTAWSGSGRLPLHALQRVGANISQGRNAAIAAATGDVIASTDAGVRLDTGWLQALVAPFGSCDPEAAPAVGCPAPTISAVSGWFVADPETAFETAMGATVLPDEREIKAETFLPSSRSVAFRREAWERAGGYPEWLDYCEDLIFDLRLRELYGPSPFVPQATVHFRPRGTLRAFFWQYYRYARGDGKADLWRRRHAIRYLTYLVAGPALVVLALLSSPAWWLVLLLGVAVYTATPYRRLAPQLPSLSPADRLRALIWVPIIRVVGDLAKMLGYPVGLAWRRQNRHRPEVHWRKRAPDPQVDATLSTGQPPA